MPIVLIVDDYEDACIALERLARRMGADAACVTNGTKVLDVMTQRRPSLVILDDMMPAVSGLDVLRSIREDAALRDVPVVMYSGSDDAERRAEAAELGALGWVVKNGHFNELKTYIAHYGTSANLGV